VAQYSLNAQLNKCMFRSCKHSCFFTFDNIYFDTAEKVGWGQPAAGKKYSIRSRLEKVTSQN